MSAQSNHLFSFPAPLQERCFVLIDEAATASFGWHCAHAIDALRCAAMRTGRFEGLHIQLLGDLGAGKTTLARAILNGLGHTGRVKSPTYTLVEPYALERPGEELIVHHFDLYRMNNATEWDDAGFREYFGGGAICLIEWPQQAGAALGVPDLMFSLDVDGDSRVLRARAYSPSGTACLEKC